MPPTCETVTVVDLYLPTSAGRFCIMEVVAIEYLLFLFHDAGSESFHRICERVLYDKTWK